MEVFYGTRNFEFHKSELSDDSAYIEGMYLECCLNLENYKIFLSLFQNCIVSGTNMKKG